MQASKYKIFSFFSGSGLLDLGFESCGYDIVMVNEYFKPFIEAYQHARVKLGHKAPRFGYSNIDINEYLAGRKEELRGYVKQLHSEGSITGFIGGPPCPDFSVGGKNRGRDGGNGKLSKSYVDLIIDMKPGFFLFENVKGLWRTQRHREFFEELKTELHNAGYVTTERLVNALEYGVPQDRDRILLFGVHSSLTRPEHYDKMLVKDFPWTSYVLHDLKAVKKAPWPGMDGFAEDGAYTKPEGIQESLTVEYWFNKNEVETHPNANDYFQPRNGLSKMQSILEGDNLKKSYKRLHRWKYSPTAAYGNNEVHLHPYKARRISAAEALALQSLPKEFELPKDMSLSNKFKTIGNGVPFLLAKGIAKTMLDYLEELYAEGNRV